MRGESHLKGVGALLGRKFEQEGHERSAATGGGAVLVNALQKKKCRRGQRVACSLGGSDSLQGGRALLPEKGKKEKMAARGGGFAGSRKICAAAGCP